MKETPFRPPQPCPLPARTPPLHPGLSAAPVPAAPPASHSNPLRNDLVDRRHPRPRGGLPPLVSGGRKSRSCWTSGQAVMRAAPKTRGRGTAEATRLGQRERGMGRRPRARSSRAGRQACARVGPGATGRGRAPRGSRTSLSNSHSQPWVP